MSDFSRLWDDARKAIHVYGRFAIGPIELADLIGEKGVSREEFISAFQHDKPSGIRYEIDYGATTWEVLISKER